MAWDTKLPKYRFEKGLERVVFDIMKTEDSYIEIDKIISDLKNH